MLDLRISYDCLKMDYDNDPTISNQLEDSKAALFEYFDAHYATLPVHNPMPLWPLPLPSSSALVLPVDGSPQKSFMARYR